MTRGAGARCPPHCPLCLRSQAQLPKAPARPVVWGQVTAAQLLWGAGPVPQMDIHRSHAPWVSHQLPEGTPGTSCSPRTLRGAAHSRRTGPGPAAPPSGTLWSQAGLIGGVPGAGKGGTLWAGCHPGHRQLWKRSPLCPRLGLWSIFWATWASWSFALGAPHLHSLPRRPGQARSEGREVHPGGLLHLPTCRRSLSSQLPPRGGGLLCPLKQGPCWKWSTWVWV